MQRDLLDRVDGRVLLTASALYAASALWFLWPLPAALSTHLVYPESAFPLVAADADFALWAMSWTAHALVHDPLHLFDANIFYPMPGSLALSDHMLGHQPVFAPVFLASGNPVLAGNVLLLFDLWLAAMGAFLLATRFVPAAPALVAGAAYAFVAVRHQQTMHLHVLAVGWMALALFFADRWLERARWRDGALLSVTLALQLLCSFYLAYMVLVGVACALPVLLWRWRARLDTRRVAGVLAWCAVAALPFLAASVPYLLLRRDGYLPSYEGEGGGAGQLDPILARHTATAILVWQGAGPVALALALVGLLPPWRGRCAALALAAALVTGGWLVGRGPADVTLGPLQVTSPYRLLQAWLPGFATIRLPDRILNVAALGVALLAALGAARVLRVAGGRALPSWGAATVLAAAVVALPWLRHEVVLHGRDVGDHAPPAVRWLARHGDGRPLLELPPKVLRSAARRMLASTAHWLPLFDGYTSHPPPIQRYLALRTQELPRAEALARLLRETDVGWILVHGDDLQPAARERWGAGELPSELEPVAAFGADRLFRVHARGPTRPQSPLYDGARTPGGVSRAPLGARCPGRLELASAPAGLGRDGGVLAAGKIVALLVRVTNDGDRAWPGGGLHPSGQVRLLACVRRADAPASPCAGAGAPLLDDVAPGASIEVGHAVGIPRTPTDYVLQVELVQIGVGSLAACGVAPLALPIAVRERNEGLPPGSYWMSCRDCAWDGSVLACECLDGAGRWTATSSAEGCAAGLVNVDGRLACEAASAAE